MRVERPASEPDPKKDLHRLAEAMQSVAKDVERLRRAVTLLSERLRPVDGETLPSERFPSGLPSAASPRVAHPVTLRSLGTAVGHIGHVVGEIEGDVRAIRARMDVIEGDVVYRVDMKQYLVAYPRNPSRAGVVANSGNERRDRRG